MINFSASNLFVYVIKQLHCLCLLDFPHSANQVFEFHNQVICFVNGSQLRFERCDKVLMFFPLFFNDLRNIWSIIGVKCRINLVEKVKRSGITSLQSKNQRNCDDWLLPPGKMLHLCHGPWSLLTTLFINLILDLLETLLPQIVKSDLKINSFICLSFLLILLALLLSNELHSGVACGHYLLKIIVKILLELLENLQKDILILLVDFHYQLLGSFGRELYLL